MSEDRVQAQVLKYCSAFLVQWDRGLNPELDEEAHSVRRVCVDLLNHYFRYRGFIRKLLSRFVGKRKLDSQVRHLLELTLTQLIFQTGISHFHGVNAAVDYMKPINRGASGFVNGVLRNFCRNHESLLGQGVDGLKKYYKKNYDLLFLGQELYASYRRRFSPIELDQQIAILEAEAPLSLRLMPGCQLEIPEYCQEFHPDLPIGDYRVFHCQDAPRFFSEDNQEFFVQDATTLVAVNLVEANGENLLLGDFCAAPGGKSVCVAEKLAPSSRLISCDKNRFRLRQLRENLARFPQVEVRENDALQPSFSAKSFDCVLLDVPCSNSGVVRKRPDVKWRFSRNLVNKLAALQFDMFKKTLPLIREGGSIVYSTCSIDPEENQLQVQRILEQFPQCRLEHDFETIPSEDFDGGYAALIRIK
jgi:16S rRNA (cytosine967-C5)-methyltransferase